MPKAIQAYVRYVDAVNRAIGRFAMYMIFAMLAMLLYPPVLKALNFILGSLFIPESGFYELVSPFLHPPLWSLEIAQFSMAAYYLLGGGYSMQLESHVRMDLVYGRWSSKRKGFADSLTAFCLVFYLVLLLYGGLSSTQYALFYGETSSSGWSPYMAPIKIVMTFGIFLMLLQAIAMFFRDLARARGMAIDGSPLPEETPA
ncbi:MAG: TRAP transporter small permease subunit [Proteobacteria bacterium]|nr:TRAP transporter small permease subunit [Pseudomonadota bacterium]